ncbi:hypothetical protein JE952_002370 [Flavobacterium psychrophilum]|uniref:hypothetical protein n=1 Tax=Flavobacterium psychrophilum TaxID=96345 RepID=UPI000A38EB80|nr:hypothetical protein [Flavobacterium psychrophilum]EKT4550716.1 hypothetical protein [Flavobacterium psychrophilum]ELM3645053.1 hypothetical protein [Flavobacterium psychrophilum]OUD22954.1 hypothetical protein FPG92_13220 [Flavobacterium psychrophilum]
MKNLFFGLIATVMFGFSASAANEIKEIEIKKEKTTAISIVGEAPITTKKADTAIIETAPPRSIICWIVFIFSNDHCPG